VTEYESALRDWIAGTDASGERAAAPKSGMAGFVKKSPGHSEALERVRAWTGAHFGLADDVTIMVSELACTLPGCPPLETVVAFWTETDKRHHFKIFKPVAEVVVDDLPPAWLKDALAVPDGQDCDCC
jgi:nitrate reductase delta subunit